MQCVDTQRWRFSLLSYDMQPRITHDTQHAILVLYEDVFRDHVRMKKDQHNAMCQRYDKAHRNVSFSVCKPPADVATELVTVPSSNAVRRVVAAVRDMDAVCVGGICLVDITSRCV